MDDSGYRTLILRHCCAVKTFSPQEPPTDLRALLPPDPPTAAMIGPTWKAALGVSDAPYCVLLNV